MCWNPEKLPDMLALQSHQDERSHKAGCKASTSGEALQEQRTQAGRVEFALAGGRVDTDAIDNSAGVDTSDHEVNIKILTGAAERAGRSRGPSVTRFWCR